MLTTEDIDTMEKCFRSRTASKGKIIFGTNRTKDLKALTYWTQDFHRISKVPTVIGSNGSQFLADLRRDEIRDKIRKTLKESDVPSVANPGPLTKESKWKEWEEKFINYLRLHLGANGVPLSYVIRKNDEPDVDTVITDYISETIDCAPLKG